MGSTEPRSIKIANWNARSVRAKKIELGTFLAQHDIDVGVITETRLSPKVNFSIPKYTTMVRLNRPDSSGGGVAVIVKQGIRYKILPHPRTSIIEAIGIQIHTPQGDISFYAVYAPRQCVDSNGSSKLFSEDLKKLNNGSGYVIAGDLNTRHTLW